jgi:hypothetical protein
VRVAEALGAAARLAAVVGVVLTTGCASIVPQPEAESQAVPMAPTASVESKAVATVPPTQATTTLRASTSDKATAPKAVLSASAVEGTAKAALTPSKASAKSGATPSSEAPPAKSESPALALSKPQAAPLDLKSLETRLKETPAIGVFSKLTLKNQIDDLLGQFRAFYQGKAKTSLADLRRSYDMLVLKVLALLQDADPPLAGAIAASREAIWAILSNPAKFAAA